MCTSRHTRLIPSKVFHLITDNDRRAKTSRPTSEIDVRNLSKKKKAEGQRPKSRAAKQHAQEHNYNTPADETKKTGSSRRISRLRNRRMDSEQAGRLSYRAHVTREMVTGATDGRSLARFGA